VLHDGDGDQIRPIDPEIEELLIEFWQSRVKK
jgi:hypothetical protein